MHGADRLGRNSLSDMLVFGKRAGEYAAEYAKGSGEQRPKAAQADIAQRGRGPGPVPVRARSREPVPHQDLQEVMQDLVGIIHRRIGTERSAGKNRRFASTGRRCIRGGQPPIQPRVASGHRSAKYVACSRSRCSGCPRAPGEPRSDDSGGFPDDRPLLGQPQRGQRGEAAHREPTGAV